MAERRSDGGDTAVLLGDDTPAGCRDLRPIARTAHSVLYRGYHEQLDRVVAVKVAAAPVSGSRARAFRDAARAVEQVAGVPYVAGVLAWGLTDAGRPFTLRTCFERGSLLDALNESGPLPVADVLHVGVLMTAALGSAHLLGVLHQNITPNNIMLSDSGQPLLADFAVSQLSAPATVAPGATALPVHRAPEQLSGRAPSVAGDVYSLGSVLFHLLTGRPPYHDDGAGAASLLLRMLHDEPPRVVRADVPPAVAAVISRAMAVEPADRYPDAFAVVAALQAVQAELGLAVSGGPMTPTPTLTTQTTQTTQTTEKEHLGAASSGPVDVHVAPRKPVRRRRWPAAAGMGTAAVAAIGVPLALGGSTHPAHPAQTGTPQAATSVVSSPATGTAGTTGTAEAPAGSAGSAGSVGSAGSTSPLVGPPSGLIAADDGSAVSLHWTLPPGSDAYPVLVQMTPVGGAHPAPIPLAAGTRAYMATGLSSTAGYCFQAGLLLRFGDAARPPTEVWSAPACVRGAVAS